MRRRRRPGRILIGVTGVLLVLLLAAALVLPGMLDWTRYRDTIEAFASAGMERPVAIGGAVTLELLPQPVLTAQDVQFGDQSGEAGDGVRLAVRELRLLVGLPALFAGRLDIRELTLRGAEMRIAWPPKPGAIVQRPPAWLSGSQARIEEGRLEVGGLALTGIDAGLQSDPVTGTLSAAGAVTYAGRPWRFTARIGSPGRDGSATAEGSIDGQGPIRDTGGTFSGQIGRDGSLSGRVFGRGPDLSALVPAPAVAWRADGRLLVSGGSAIADELALQVGGAPARGALALRIVPDPRLDIAVAASQLDLDAWLPVLLHGAQVPLPTTLDLSSEAASLVGGTVRHLRGAFDLAAEGTSVREATAILPGDAQITLSGQIKRETPPNRTAPVPRFDGEVRVAAPDLRTTLRWLQPVAPELIDALPTAGAGGVLRTAQLQAKLGMEPGQLSTAGIRGTLDGARIGGDASVRLSARPGAPAGERPYFGAGLQLDGAALDGWLPDPAALLQPATLADARRRASALDFELRVEARRATWRGSPVEGFALDAQASGGRLALRRLEARAGGLRAGASGTLLDDGRVAEGRLEMEAADSGVLQALLPPDWAARAARLLRGRMSAQASASGLPDALAVRLTADLGDLRFEAQPTLDIPARRAAGTVALRHPGAPRLLESLGFPGAAAWLGDGSFSLVSQGELQPGRLTADSFSLSAGVLRASGQATLTGKEAGAAGPGGAAADTPAVTGRVIAETLPLPLPYWRSPEPLSTALLHGWRASLLLEAGQVLFDLAPALEKASATLTLGDGTLRLDRLAATALGGTWAASAALDASAEPPRLTAEASVAGASLPGPLLELPSLLDVAAGRFSLRAKVSASGHSPAALIATLSGSVSASVQDGIVSGFDLASLEAALRAALAGEPGADAAATDALSGGRSALSSLDLLAEAERGIIRMDGTALSGPSGRAALSGVVALPSATVDLRIALQPGLPDTRAAGAPDIAVRLTGPVGSPRRTPELAPVLRWLAERRQQGQ